MVWSSDEQDGDQWGSFARVFDQMGVALTPEIQVNQSVVGDQIATDVATDSTGSFVVVWQSRAQASGPWEIHARRFSVDGTPLSDEYPVAQHPQASNCCPAVASTSDGGFIATWAVRPQPLDYHNWGYSGQIYSPDGSPVGEQFEVVAPSPSASYWSQTRIDVLPDQGFVVGWSHDSRVYARVFDHDGVPSTVPFQVSSPDDPWPYHDTLGEVEVDSQGGFSVAWAREITLGPTGSHFASRYSADGTHQWTVEMIWYYAGLEGQGFSMTLGGDFVAVWGFAGTGMTAGCFDASGQPSLEPWSLGSGNPGSHVSFQAEHQSEANQHFVVVWQGYGDIFGLRSLLLFADGFEAGDTNWWSASRR